MYAYIRGTYTYSSTCTQTCANECASNFARDRRALAERGLGFLRASAIFGAAGEQEPMRGTEKSRYFKIRNASRALDRSAKSRDRDPASSALVISRLSLGFPSERLSLTSVYTSPSLPLFRPRTAHQHARRFPRVSTRSNRYSSRRSGD